MGCPAFRHIVCSPKRAGRALDEIHSPNLQIIFDPVNLLDMVDYRERDAVFRETIDLLGADIAMARFKDFRIRDGRIPVGCGMGEMDYMEILKFRKERKPFIHATLEDTEPDNNRKMGILYCGSMKRRSVKRIRNIR